MNPRNEIWNELNSLSPMLAGIAKGNVFTVPVGYFQRSEEDILEKTVFTPTFNEVKFNSASSVPDGYFDTLSDQILNKIKSTPKEDNASDELRKLSPLLYSIQNEEVLEIPTGYFEHLSDEIMFRLDAPAKVVKMERRTAWKMAVAAVTTGLIAMASLWFSNQTETTTIDKPELTTLVAYQLPDVSGLIEESKQYKTENEINTEIASLPEEEIISYLQKMGSYEDLELLASTIDTEELPGVADYLTDDKALETYLDEMSSDLNN